MSFPSRPQLSCEWRFRCGGTLQKPDTPQLIHSQSSRMWTHTSLEHESCRLDVQPVPVGAADPLDAEAEESMEDEEAAEEPTYTLAKGYGRFAIRYTRLATALGNFEQGNAQTESAVVGGWLTSGLEIAMHRMGWSLLSPRQELTRLPSRTLSNHHYYGYPPCREEDRPYQQHGNVICTDDQWDRLCAWLTGDPTFRKIEHHKKELKEEIEGKRDDINNRTKARRIAPPPGVGSSSPGARPYYRNWPHTPPPRRGWWE